MNTNKQLDRANTARKAVRLTVVGHTTTTSAARPHITTLLVRRADETAAQARALLELHVPGLSAYEVAYLNWFHGDPLKRSLTQAHRHSLNHRTELMASHRCGCFHCGARFAPAHITEWVRDTQEDTAFCPQCDIDAVLGDASGYPITPEFLSAMKGAWFGMD